MPVFALLSTFAALGGLAASFAAPAIPGQLGIGKTRILAGIARVPAVALTPQSAVLPWFPGLWTVLWIWALLAGTASVPIACSPMETWTTIPADVLGPLAPPAVRGGC